MDTHWSILGRDVIWFMLWTEEIILTATWGNVTEYISVPFTQIWMKEDIAWTRKRSYSEDNFKFPTCDRLYYWPTKLFAGPRPGYPSALVMWLWLGWWMWVNVMDASRATFFFFYLFFLCHKTVFHSEAALLSWPLKSPLYGARGGQPVVDK